MIIPILVTAIISVGTISKENSDTLSNLIRGSIEKYSLESITPEDVKKFTDTIINCQDFRLYFWTALFKAIMKKESDFNSASVYVEGFEGNNGKKQISAGLMQMSLDDSKIYGCRFRDSSSLHNDSLNIDCAARVMAYQLKKVPYILKIDTGYHFDKKSKTREMKVTYKGLSAYWSSLRPDQIQGTINDFKKYFAKLRGAGK